MTCLPWEAVLQNPRIANGEIEFVNGKHLRGPIRDIRVKQNAVVFELEWCAMRAGDKWKSVDGVPELVFDKESTKLSRGPNDTVIIEGGGALASVFPEGGSRLDPALVEGLDLRREPIQAVD